MDYHAIAIRLIGRSPLSAALIAVQTRGRKAGLRKTTATTLRQKSRARLNKLLSLRGAEAIIHLYSELGLGDVTKPFRTPVITWNPRLDMRSLGAACETLIQRWKATRKVAEIGKGPTVVCMLPQGSLDALKSSGLAALLEIEGLGEPRQS